MKLAFFFALSKMSRRFASPNSTTSKSHLIDFAYNKANVHINSVARAIYFRVFLVGPHGDDSLESLKIFTATISIYRGDFCGHRAIIHHQQSRDCSFAMVKLAVNFFRLKTCRQTFCFPFRFGLYCSITISMSDDHTRCTVRCQIFHTTIEWKFSRWWTRDSAEHWKSQTEGEWHKFLSWSCFLLFNSLSWVYL